MVGAGGLAFEFFVEAGEGEGGFVGVGDEGALAGGGTDEAASALAAEPVDERVGVVGGVGGDDGVDGEDVVEGIGDAVLVGGGGGRGGLEEPFVDYAVFAAELVADDFAEVSGVLAKDAPGVFCRLSGHGGFTLPILRTSMPKIPCLAARVWYISGGSTARAEGMDALEYSRAVAVFDGAVDRVACDTELPSESGDGYVAFEEDSFELLQCHRLCQACVRCNRAISNIALLLHSVKWFFRSF